MIISPVSGCLPSHDLGVKVVKEPLWYVIQLLCSGMDMQTWRWECVTPIFFLHSEFLTQISPFSLKRSFVSARGHCEMSTGFAFESGSASSQMILKTWFRNTKTQKYPRKSSLKVIQIILGRGILVRVTE